MAKASAPVLMDGVQIGAVTVGDDTEVSPDPLGDNFAFAPAPAPDVFPQRFASREYRGRSLGGDHGPSHGTPPHAEKRPTYRHGVGPGSQATAKSDKPEHFSLQDIKQHVEHGGGLKGSAYLKNERQWIADELSADPSLRRYLGGVLNHEQGGEGRHRVAESLFNRLNMLRQNGQPNLTLREYLSRQGNNQFYGPIRRGQITPSDSANAEIEQALSGSNDIRGMTDQGSAGDPNFGRGETIMHQGEGYNDFGGEMGRRYREQQQRQVEQGGTVDGKPVGVTRLGPTEPTNFPSHVVGKLGLVDPITGTALGGGPGESRGNHAHQGLDILAPAGSPIYAAGSGTIVNHNPHGSFQGDAFTYIKLDNGMTVAYGHHNLDPNLKAGSRVEAGQQIGTSGTANSVPHLHFETWAGKPHQSNLYDPRQVFGWSKNNLPRGGQGARTNPTAGKSSSMSSDDYTKSKDYEGARGDDVRKRLQDINRTRPGMNPIPGRSLDPNGSSPDPRFAPFLPQVRDIRKT
jgi:murein DD-endopeptidase MepM/ murein hydrolase activator NlpD